MPPLRCRRHFRCYPPLMPLCFFGDAFRHAGCHDTLLPWMPSLSRRFHFAGFPSRLPPPLMIFSPPARFPFYHAICSFFILFSSLADTLLPCVCLPLLPLRHEMPLRHATLLRCLMLMRYDTLLTLYAMLMICHAIYARYSVAADICHMARSAIYAL